MAALDPTSARWMAAPGRGHYESYFVEAGPNGGGRGLWLRFTAKRQLGGSTTGALWAAYVDAADEPAVAVRSADLPLHAGNGRWIRCGVSTFSPDGTQGSVEIDGHAVSWDLAFASMEQPLHHLPRPWMYAARLPRTKLFSPLPAATVSGRLTVARSHGRRRPLARRGRPQLGRPACAELGLVERDRGRGAVQR